MDRTNWMQRCLQLARLGAGTAAPNPLVGAVLVQGDRLLAEGWHHAAGHPHAEVECLKAFGDGPVPEDAVMYVSLEPCAHHGRTPPCADLLVARGVRHVVVAQEDPFPAVAGKGIAKLRESGVNVQVGEGEAEARWTNRRFLTSVERDRPYIVLKWARSSDGFLDRHPREARGVQRISAPATDVLVHRWRSEEQAILVGSRTVVNDDPRLTVRLVEGRHPFRVVIDRNNRAPAASRVFDDAAPTLVFTRVRRGDIGADQVLLREAEELLPQVLDELHRRGVRSLLVEGGAELLGHFLRSGAWDEARVITGAVAFGRGTPAPVPGTSPVRQLVLSPDRIDLHVNGTAPDPAWPW